MVSLEHLVAACVRERTVLDHLGATLRDDLVLANPFLRRIVEFVDDFAAEHRMLPGPGDWELWLGGLTAGMEHDGTLEALQRVNAVDLSGFQPEFLAEEAGEQITRAAVHVALCRLNALEKPEPEAFLNLAQRVAALRNGRRPTQQWPTLASLAEDADLTREPDELIPRLVWAGTFTVLAGPAFAGKSTLGAQGAAALSRAAPFLDGRHPGPERALWCNVADEPLARTVQRLTGYGANGQLVRLYDFRHPAQDLRASLLRAVEEAAPAVVVIDSLIAWARRTSPETPGSGDAAAWAEVMRPLGDLAHERGVGLLVFHHANRGGHYRDSTEIAAAADVLIEMRVPRPGSDPATRQFVADSRLTGRTVWTATYREGQYALGGDRAPEGTDGDPGSPKPRLPRGQAKTLAVLPESGATWTEWLAVRDMSQSGFAAQVHALKAAGLVRQDPEGRYRRTAAATSAPDTEH